MAKGSAIGYPTSSSFTFICLLPVTYLHKKFYGSSLKLFDSEAFTAHSFVILFLVLWHCRQYSFPNMQLRGRRREIIPRALCSQVALHPKWAHLLAKVPPFKDEMTGFVFLNDFVRPFRAWLLVLDWHGMAEGSLCGSPFVCQNRTASPPNPGQQFPLGKAGMTSRKRAWPVLQHCLQHLKV